ncbi:discoidin domain-containing protein [Opitutaceae bacterium]|nr:discoidin domain-containing protein [Opitutaceae bacterium]
MTFTPLKALSLVLGASAGSILTAAEMTELKLEFPPPLVISTPAPIKVPHLELPNAKPAKVMVPSDVTNVAAGKSVLSSDPYPILGEPDFITDGDKESEDGYYVEFEPGLQWAQVDLEEAQEVFAIAIWHYHIQKRAYHDVVVQISDDPEFTSGVTTVFNNDHDDSSGLGRGGDPAYIETNRGRLIPVKQITGRYIRAYTNGNSTDELNHVVEIEVFGRPSS